MALSYQPTIEGSTSLREVAQKYYSPETPSNEKSEFATELLQKALKTMELEADWQIPMQSRADVVALLSRTLHDAVDELEAKAGSDQKADLIRNTTSADLRHLASEIRKGIVELGAEATTTLQTMLNMDSRLTKEEKEAITKMNSEILDVRFDLNQAGRILSCLAEFLAGKKDMSHEQLADNLHEAVFDAVHESVIPTDEQI